MSIFLLLRINLSNSFNEFQISLIIKLKYEYVYKTSTSRNKSKTLQDSKNEGNPSLMNLYAMGEGE